MTIGIYILKFENTSKVYVGQSSNIQKRFNEHIRSMLSNTSTPKLQEAYNTYGLPKLEILIENCTLDELNLLEEEAIGIFNSIRNGFNTLEKVSNPNIRGLESIHAKFDKETYKEIYRLLATTKLSIKEISEKTNTTNNVVQRIWSGFTHNWLEKEMPIEYELIKTLRPYGRYSKNTDRFILSPEGIVYKIEKINSFCREHNLDRGHISSVLSGKRKSHKGWIKYDSL